MVDEPVDERRGQPVVVDHRVPMPELEVRGDGHAPTLVTVGYHLEQKLGRVAMQGQEAQPVHDEQIA